MAKNVSNGVDKSMNHLIRDFDREHPGIRKKLNKILSRELKLYIKIGFPDGITNLANIINMRLIKIIVEDGDKIK